MRLTSQQISIIKDEITKKDKNAKIYLFGSRVDDNALGGDIDLLVLSQEIDFSLKIKIQAQLFIKLNEQQVDLLIAKNTEKPFVQPSVIRWNIVMTNKPNKRALQQALLKENSEHLILASKQLQASFIRCNLITLNTETLGFEELERFEALTSRFARLADLILQKAIRLIEILELEGSGTILDRINKAEKRGLINSSAQFIEIRQLRNSIAHEYDAEALTKIFEDCLQFTPTLLTTVENVALYIDKKELLSKSKS